MEYTSLKEDRRGQPPWRPTAPSNK